jgi:hypothetical protein
MIVCRSSITSARPCDLPILPLVAINLWRWHARLPFDLCYIARVASRAVPPQFPKRTTELLRRRIEHVSNSYWAPFFYECLSGREEHYI